MNEATTRPFSATELDATGSKAAAARRATRGTPQRPPPAPCCYCSTQMKGNDQTNPLPVGKKLWTRVV